MFRGVVRSTEPPVVADTERKTNVEHSIEGLQYQIYEPMTSQELQQLAVDLCRRHGVLAMDVQHSFGFVAGGQCSFVLQVASRHREEGIRCMDEFIYEMKRQVPIWKVPRFESSETV